MDTLLNNHGMPGNRHVRLSRLMLCPPPVRANGPGPSQGPGFREFCATLEEAAAAGINCLSSRPENEEMLGRGLTATGLHDFMFVAAQTSSLIPGGLTAKSVRKDLERSLKETLTRLGTEWLPLVLLNSKTDPEYLPELAESCRRNLAGYCGIALPEPGSPVPLFDHPAFGAVEIPGSVPDCRFSATVRAARDRGALIFCREAVGKRTRNAASAAKPGENYSFLHQLAWELETTPDVLLLRAMLDRDDIDSVVVEIPHRRKLREYLALLRLPMLPREITRRLAGIERLRGPDSSRTSRI